MRLEELHNPEKSVSAVSLFKGLEGNALALRLLQGEELKEHSSKVPALLICVAGEALFEDEKGHHRTLLAGDYILIEPLVKHRVQGLKQSDLLLLK